MVLAAALTRFALVAPLAAPLALAAACSIIPEGRDGDAPPVYVSEARRRPVEPRDDVVLRQVMLEAHNDARADVGAAPIGWDAALAADARRYAEELARRDRFEHSHDLRALRQGENLWKGTASAFTYEEMVGAWVDERADFKPGLIPDNSRNGRPVGHYTQIIWPATSEVGCAMAANRKDEYLVCRYAPAGNIIGQDPLG